VVITALLVLICGGLGAVARFLLDSLVQSRGLFDFPMGTLVVNLSGAFLLGLLVGAGSSQRSMTLLGTATLGSYTTFSTWMLESHRPAQDGQSGLALVNVGGALLAGLVAVLIGRAIGKTL
jgi:fluoride exporter